MRGGLRAPAGFLLPLLVLGFLSIPPIPAAEAEKSRSETQAAYRKTRNCRIRLKSRAKRSSRRNWENCIKMIDLFIDEFPDAAQAPRALLDEGNLYLGLFRLQKKKSDLVEAKRSFEKVLERKPSGPLAAAARGKLKEVAAAESQQLSRDKKRAMVTGVRYWSYPEYTRVVLDLDRETKFRKNDTNDRLAVLLPRASLKEGVAREVPVGDGLVDWIRLDSDSEDRAQILVGVTGMKRNRVLPLSNPDRLVIDIFGERKGASGQPLPSSLIVLDPGHGGKDPGAIGKRGLTEKEVVLDVALRLKRLLTGRMNKTVIMTRASDLFIPLEERTLAANGKHADLFVSIHANAHPSAAVRGVEIYHLGQATDARALATAMRENAASQKATENFGKLLAADLVREFFFNQSLALAHLTDDSFEKNFTQSSVPNLGVKQAPFYVLAHTNMPAILAEIGFISNPSEEKRLASDAYREQIAEALFEGIRAYLSENSASP